MSVNTPLFLPNDLEIAEGTILGNSYKVEDFLREGSFGYVTKCLDTQTNKGVAIKVNKNDPESVERAKLEMFILEQLRCLDPDRCNIVKWNGFFLDRERICLNFELLDQSLFDYMKDRNNQGLHISELRPILFQLVNALSHLISMGIVHTDLKPDNLMVVDRHQSPVKVKIIDFGLACPVSSLNPCDDLQTTWYRAPEVMVSAPFNQAIDMWSLGTIAAELAIGLPLYPGETEFDVLRFIRRTQGQPPDCVLDRGFDTERYFIQENCGNRRWRFKSKQEFKRDEGYQMRETRYFKLKSLDDLEQLMKKRTGHHSGQDLLVSLIKQMLHLDYNQRITPLAALRHPFFDPGPSSQNSSRDACIDMHNKEDQSLVRFQQPSYCQSKSPHSIVRNPVELPEQTPLNMSVNKPSVLPNDLEIAEGTILGNSYKVEDFLREGSFGYVTKCLDTQTNKGVAIKVNKNDPESVERAKLEIFILEQLRCLDPDRCNIVKWNGFFLDRERICLNFELLDQTLFDYMKDRNNQGLHISELRPILYQLTNALSHLSSMGIVHTDLKPDNLMVVDRHQSPVKVKIIDFGMACPVSSLNPCDDLQTTWYRAPEVMVSAPFNQAIDMWSLGTIAAELAIGLPLYPGETEFDVLRFIISTQGQPPDCVLDRGFDTERYFIQENCGNRRWRFKSEQEFQHDEGYQMRETRYFKLKSLDDLKHLMKKRTGHHSGQDLLVSLIKQMLHLDYNQRITPLAALRHPFFDPGPSSRDACIDMHNKEDQSLVRFQQPSYCQSKSPHSIVRNPVELPEQTPLNMSVKKPSVLSNDLDIVEGTILGNFYKVEALLGEGCFGHIVKCLDTRTNKAVAIKVSRNDFNCLKQAILELFMLEQLRCLDPDRCNIVKWNGFFRHRKCICLNFEVLDQNLYHYMKDRNTQGIPIFELRPILFQLINALSHLSSMGIVHTDLKPDNLMVVDRHQSPVKVKIIDFGMACHVSSLDPRVPVQPLWYRAPEVMVCAPFNQAIDMWSLGTIAAELAIGLPLYPGETEFDVLRFIIRTQGQPSDCVLDRGFDTEHYFIEEDCGNRHWRFKSEEEFQHDEGYQMRETRYFKLKSLDDLEQLMKKRTGHHSGQDLLVSLIKQMLHFDDNQRITPLAALQHPFFDPGPSSRDACIDMHNKEDQSLVRFQQPSYCQSKSPHSIVRNPVELPEQTPLNMSVKKSSVLTNNLDIVEGTILGNFYKVEALLGQGCFGHVVKCLDTRTNKAVAIKVSWYDSECLEQAILELFILEQLRCLDPDRCNIVKWNGFFGDRERICLNFEVLDENLYDYLIDRSTQGIPIFELRPILFQLVNALSHLSSMGIVHTDLKPDNLMVVDRHQSPVKVKIIDFGLACHVSSLDPRVPVQPLWYRAPEVMVSAPFNQAIDMWSLGTIAAELAIGMPLYPGETEFDVLSFIIRTKGQPPDCVLDRGFDTERYFIQENCGNRHWRFKSEQEFQHDEGYQMRKTQYFKLKSLDDLEQLMKKRTGHHSGQDLLVSLIKQMLHLDYNQRITPLAALQHPFFDPGLSSRYAWIDMHNKEDQSLVRFQQPSYCQSKSPHSIVRNPVELPEQTPLNMSVKKSSVLTNNLDIVEGTILGNFYKVEALLGEGCFGHVVKCLDTRTNKAVAIKVNWYDSECLEQAILELFILEQLRCLDPDRCNIVKWNGFFRHRECICLNFEVLDQNLYDYLIDRSTKGIPIFELRPILFQLVNALSHLSSMGIVHTDLKPDNLMVVDRHQSPVKVKIIDFGMACHVSSLDPRVPVQPLWYRAPEVMVSAPFNQAIDMWSLGTIAAELAIGLPLYPGETEFDVLRFIRRTQGQLPDCVLDRGFDTERYFIQENCGNRHWRFKSEEEFQHDEGYQMRETRYFKLKRLDDLEQLMKKRTGHHSGQDLLVSLIKQMLHLDYNQRITPLAALRHPFFDPGPSSRDACIDMHNKEAQSLVRFQQPSYCQSKSPHSIVRNPVELPEQTPLNMSVKKSSVLSNDLDIVEGTILGNFYKVEALLGEGCFGHIVKCLDTRTNKAVAIKVSRNDFNCLEQAILELFMLEQLRCLDPDRCNIVKWNGFFRHRECICLNFELLDQSLLDYIKDRNNQGLPIFELRPILFQLTNALSHLSFMGIVHTDLKPDNLMVVDRHKFPIKVKLIDFGLACPVSSLDATSCVQSRWHRAPEVMVSAPFNQAIDMWSLGVIAVHIAIGLPLYPGETELDVLRFIILTQGQPPDCVLDRGFNTKRYFIQENCSNRHWRFKSEQEFFHEEGYQMQDTRYFKLKSLDDLEQLMKKRTGHHSGQDLLVSLIKQMLHLDYNQRITPSEALRHPFFEPGPSYLLV